MIVRRGPFGLLLATAIALSGCWGHDDTSHCEPVAEVCDGVDNDCDGQTDETGCSVACEVGAVRCTDGGLQACVEQDGAASWGPAQACPTGACADDTQCLECSDGCTQAGATACSGGAVRTCVADTHGCLDWSAGTACPSGVCADATQCASCDDGCPAEGVTECTGGEVRTCQADAQGCLAWGAFAACSAGVCADATSCANCTNGCPSAGTTSCTDGRLKTCVADAQGCLAWGSEAACADGFCADTASCGTCNDGCPSAGTTACSGGQLTTCEADANGCLDWSSPTACAGGFCADTTSCGTCSDGCPAQGTTECSGGQSRTCETNASGCLAWSAWADCPDAYCTSATTCGSPPPLVISEILVDSNGSPDVDAFIELHGAPGTSLAGLSLVGINGNGGGEYHAIALSGTIPADGYFVVAHPSGAHTAVADLLDTAADYQNGPDSVQLRRGSTVLDAVGYGTFGATDVFAGEGTAIAASPTDWSLARDGSNTDTDDNAADFRAEMPSPGQATGAPCAPGPWTTTTVDDSGYVGEYSAIAVDADRGAHISYFDGAATDLKYAYKPAGGSWTTAFVDTTGDNGKFTDITVDAGDRIHISYLRYVNGDLKYATKTVGGSAWSTTTVDGSGLLGVHTAIATGPDGVYITYYDDNYKDLLLAFRPTGGTWSHAPIVSQGDMGRYSSIAVEDSGRVHVAYMNRDWYYTQYVYRDAGSTTWSNPAAVGDPMVTAGSFISLAVDANGGVHVSQYRSADQDLEYDYRLPTGAWTSTLVDTNGTGAYNDLAVDRFGGVHIVYFSAVPGDLAYAYKPAGGTWTLSTIDAGGLVGKHASVATDAFGGVHVSYYDDTNNALKYAYRPRCQ